MKERGKENMRSREELLTILNSIVDNKEQFSADMILDIREILEEEREGN
jgi:hypothetical protein